MTDHHATKVHLGAEVRSQARERLMYALFEAGYPTHTAQEKATSLIERPDIGIRDYLDAPMDPRAMAYWRHGKYLRASRQHDLDLGFIETDKSPGGA